MTTTGGCVCVKHIYDIDISYLRIIRHQYISREPQADLPVPVEASESNLMSANYGSITFEGVNESIERCCKMNWSLSGAVSLTDGPLLIVVVVVLAVPIDVDLHLG